MKKALIIFLTSMSFIGYAQNQKATPPASKAKHSDFIKSEAVTIECVGFVDPKAIESNWKFHISNKEIKHSGADQTAIEKMKEEKRELKFATKTDQPETATEPIGTTAFVTPTVGINFLANEMYSGTPPDNTMAISNGGKIVSVDNATIEIYDAYAANPYLSIYVNHYDFFDFLNPAPTGTIFDPKVIYDSGSDRFIYCILHGTTAATSELLMCFSQTNDPTDGWWVYRIQANQGHTGSWFDYPNMGVSTNEVYVTGNMFTSGSNSFSGNVIFQMDKNDGYSGLGLTYQYWTDQTDDDIIPESAFTMVPVSYGHQGNYGPGIYLICTERPPFADEIWLFDITDDITATNETINYYEASITDFEVAAEAEQLGSNDLLDNGDTRALSGFYLNGIVHFVFACDIGNGWNGINYNRLALNNLTNTSSTFGLSGTYDYCFPTVASFASSAADKSVMIGFLRSGASIYPEVRVVNCDDAMQWSGSVQVKAGESYVNIVGSTERWGDYSGISRKHNASSPEIWMNGCYGVASNNNGATNGYNAWVAQIGGTSSPVNVSEVLEEKKGNIFPNPVSDRFSCQFNLDSKEKINISLYDSKGGLVRVFFNSTAKAGLNHLEFNKGELANGTYQFIITNSSKTILHETIVVN